MNSKLLIIVGGVLIILIAGVGGFMFLGPSGASSEGADAQAAEAEAEAKAKEEEERPPSDEPGAFLAVPERVVNLSGEGPYSVLQVTVTLEFEAPEGYHVEGGHGGNPIQEEFDLEIATFLTPIEDGLNILLSSKTGTDLVSTEGKNRLKEEIAEMVEEFVHPRVKAVYFNRFFMQ